MFTCSPMIRRTAEGPLLAAVGRVCDMLKPVEEFERLELSMWPGQILVCCSWHEHSIHQDDHYPTCPTLQGKLLVAWLSFTAKPLKSTLDAFHRVVS